MPRYEIIAHVMCELDCQTADEAAAEFRRRGLSESRLADGLLHLAVWREERLTDASPLPAPLRQQLIDFFAALERSSGQAEAEFRERVAAILMTPKAGRQGQETGFPPDPANRVLPE